ncbi:MAG: hypothetical protein GX340_07855 [Clostridiales bacterium]|jgi:hypothetical protein|nr:hypothetical protein [Clostridiales bacterium]
MSIRPVDMQVAIQRSDQYTKDINRDGQIANNQFGIAVETQKKALQSQREVSSPEASKYNNISRDDDNKANVGSNSRKNRKRTKNGRKNTDDLLADGDKGVFIDVII